MSDRVVMIQPMLSAAILWQATRAVPIVVQRDSGGTADWVVALAAGAVGAILTALFAITARALAARGDVVAHDLQASQMNRQLEAWVDDRNRKLVSDLSTVGSEHNGRGIFSSSINGAALANTKSQALHEYRDQQWRTELTLQRLAAAEGPWHRFWRVRMGATDGLALPAADRVEPVLDRWREPVTRHGTDMPVTPFDPTRRALGDLLRDVGDQALN